MTSIPDLSLLGSLQNHKITRATIPSHKAIEQTIEQATNYWIRHHRGTGWVIVTIGLDTYTQIAYEHDRNNIKTRDLGRLSNQYNPLLGVCSPTTLIIVTVDQYTPNYVYTLCEANTLHDRSRILALNVHTATVN